MASDIALVLRSEHRQLVLHAQRCGREGRGFQDPVGDLRRVLLAHLDAAASEVYPPAQRRGAAAPEPGTSDVRERVVDPGTPVDELVQVTEDLVAYEDQRILPVLESHVGLPERRRIGKLFRMRRDASARSIGTAPRSRRSQTELYELARRAGVEQRSRMTQAQLQEAVSAWEHEHRPEG